MSSISWKAGINGNWTDTSKWSTGTVPGAGDDAIIAFTAKHIGPYTVSVTSAITVNSISLTAPTATLTINTPIAIDRIAGDLTDAGAGVLIDGQNGQGGTTVT